MNTVIINEEPKAEGVFGFPNFHDYSLFTDHHNRWIELQRFVLSQV